jgi:hypothetical protein
MVAAFLVWALVSTSGPKPRTRQYLAFKACLLTDAEGVAGKQAAPVWAGMEKASLKTRAKVQNLPAFGPPTTANTQPYLRTLMSQGCNVIVAVGVGPVTAVAAEAPAHPKTQFIVAGQALSAHNLTVVDPDSLMTYLDYPNGAARTTVASEFYLRPEALAQPGFDPSPTIELWDLISRQDWAVCERAQLGVSSRSFKSGVYPSKDRLLFDFNQRWRRAMGRPPIN